MKIFLIVMLALNCILVEAEDTNIFYITDDGFLIGQKRDGQITFNPQKIAGAKKMKESLPAEEYPEGNWGSPQAGFQLSMRFEKQVFTNGEPIIATILIRNVTNQVLNYTVANIAGQDGPIGLIAINNRGDALPTKSDEITIISAHNIRLFPRTQRKYEEELNKVYNFATNNTVSIYASIRVSCPRCVELESARVQIKIE